MPNGAAARLVQVNDLLLSCLVQVTAEEALNHSPKVALALNEDNEEIIE